MVIFYHKDTHCKVSPGLPSLQHDYSSLIIAYQDDKLMTKREGEVHVLVMLIGYTFAPDEELSSHLVLLCWFSFCAAAGGTKRKEKGVCEDTSRSGRGSAPAPGEKLAK
jgi:hypothetical protein